ncbi:Hypothetical protein SRAE_1000110100 [Strongyloides ratti]|uniref:GOLD domain-containing protein n=1 Tax=Strongyloides ratti TaxID=34506 RepID=A0A090MVD2_STRRB|nr:Hypothetical protein SRAE_1000110100 [Strongyloides ratti]CEF62833.1 Hypothetical protein SRAE_1000110100 [Strongyloides ratti]
MNESLYKNIKRIVDYTLQNKVSYREKFYEIEKKSYDFSREYEPKIHEILLMQLIGMVISFITIIQALRTLVYYRYEK